MYERAKPRTTGIGERPTMAIVPSGDVTVAMERPRLISQVKLRWIRLPADRTGTRCQAHHPRLPRLINTAHDDLVGTTYDCEDATDGH